VHGHSARVAAASRWPYDEKRLLDDQTYNVQLGAAELGDLIKYYRGSYILAFAGYNAGRGRVKEWIEGGAWKRLQKLFHESRTASPLSLPETASGW
jgi:soluble lytic murein transglycosylase-like protein